MFRLTITLLLLLSGLAQAQVKPEFMLLIDTSRPMAEGAACAPAGVEDRAPAFDATNINFSASYLHMVQDALGGSRDEPYCKEFDLGADFAVEDRPHVRAYCGNQNLKPCGHDHGDPDDAFAMNDISNRGNDGIIKINKNDFKFGLMVSDARCASADNFAGAFSFGSDRFLGGGDALRESEKHILEACAPNQIGVPNMGVRSAVKIVNDEYSPPFGPLITPNMGRAKDPNGNHLDEIIPENGGGGLSPHNTWVADQIDRLYTEGERAPISAMLRDAVEYYDADDQLGCRERNMILISRGVEGHGYYTNALEQAACGANHDEYSFVDGESRCVGAAPYAPSWTHAQQLRALGVRVFVIGLNPPTAAAAAKLRRIATAGSPNVKPDGTAGYYVAQNETELREAINEILNLSQPNFEGRARPLVIIPGPGDVIGDEDIRQWRFIARTEITQEESTRYGQMEEQRLGCDELRADPDRPGALVDFESFQVHSSLNTLITRRVFTRQKTATLDRHVALIGGVNAPMFTQLGESSNNYTNAEIDLMLGNDAPSNITGAFVNGFFGDRGIPNGAMPPTGPRQLAALSEGDIVAIPPPNLGLASPAYQAYEQRHGDRPTLAAFGANDGMIHFAHAATGYEFFNFVPTKSLEKLSKAAKDKGYPTYAQMDVADLALCRTLGEGGGGDCPSNPEQIQFGTFITGALMNGDANIFGLNLTGIDDPEPLQNKLDGVLDMRLAVPRDKIWNFTEADEPKLGALNARPQLTHVRLGDQVKAAVVMGCGDAPGGDAADPDGVGRCILIIDAQTGALIHSFQKNAGAGEDLDRAIVGSPAIYPAGGISTAEFIYIGDRRGRIWRVDLRETDKANWKAEIAWPPEVPNALEQQYQLGRPVIGRPSVALREDGRRVIVFATAGEGDAGVDSTVVSFTETLVDDGQGGVKLRATGNWVFPLGANEEATDAPIVRDGIALFTTKRELAVVAQCGAPSSEGRLIGVDYVRRLVNDEGNPIDFERNGRRISVLPALPLNIGNGAKALAIVLPPGRVAYGLTVVSTPSCLVGGEPSTDVILNLSDQSGGAGAVSTRDMMVEQVQNGVIQSVAFDNQIFSESKGAALSICLNCDADGNATPTGGGERSTAPFPSQLLYWGTSFSD